VTKENEIAVPKRKNNILLPLLLLVFVGQATASAMNFCPMMMNQANSHIQMSMMDMSDMNMSATDIKMNKSMTQDCCSDGGDCLMSGCFFTTVSDVLQIRSPYFPSQIVASAYSLTHSYTVDSLYRPPILA